MKTKDDFVQSFQKFLKESKTGPPLCACIPVLDESQ